MEPDVEIIGLCHSVAIISEIYVTQHKCQMRWHNFHFKRMLIMGLINRLWFKKNTYTQNKSDPVDAAV